MGMTQKAVFTKEKIAEAAFQLTREKGWSAVTARSIAQKLGSSTMPVYSSLKSMKAVERVVRHQAEALMHEYQKRRFTGETMVDSAVGYVTFARDEHQLFRFLYEDRPLPPARGRRGKDVNEVGGVVDLADQAVTAMADERVLKSWAFVHGLASLISGGVLDLPDATVVRILREMGLAFYGQGEGK
jgi:AcrR family transcriptional regulator